MRSRRKSSFPETALPGTTVGVGRGVSIELGRRVTRRRRGCRQRVLLRQRGRRTQTDLLFHEASTGMKLLGLRALSWAGEMIEGRRNMIGVVILMVQRRETMREARPRQNDGLVRLLKRVARAPWSASRQSDLDRESSPAAFDALATLGS